MKMPKVSLHTMTSTTASLTNNKDFWEVSIERMRSDNPLLYQLLIVSETSITKEGDFTEVYKRGLALIYTLLSNQIEADEMNELWG